jgi:rhomboid protease GluP
VNETPPVSRPPFEDAQRNPTPPPPQSLRVTVPQSAPYVTYSIIAITVLFYILQLLSEYLFGSDIPVIYGARINEAILAGEWWRFLTPALLHGSLPHIAFNMYALLSFGSSLERFFGHGRFFLLYVLGAFAGNVASFLFSPGYSVGASTAIFGLLGAEAIFLIQNRKVFPGQFRSAIGNIIFIAAINLFIIGSLPGIDNWGHIGGLIGGLMFTSFAGPLWDIEGVYPAYHPVDRRSSGGVVIGAAMVIIIFAALAMWGLMR